MLRVLTVDLLTVIVKPKLELRNYSWGEGRDPSLCPMGLEMAIQEQPSVEIPIS